ncbi:phosphatidylinositol 4,5-bisphosphate 5-phosphatase A isoform X2 [Culex quinquefasciatus]|uniref:phosphatidylinositol 4,5-bisphosphate 5-phosphatase A isoform X2 n=1 Tax=Culex quinquefasciatus TaxID=7176 RepID=UPI0018E341AE|nr:phosphatidylinositol 4,5-bisphosphate 5-phosphatase A isoform X2 [Culex quinquefasciatus]XP_038109289.1 phosphatidylinositol 4,5-bisphosphate 5-phosphatase A isoform X2 [Culex quinquefasciatus]XP_038109290.1 phosphatidylinositol 4,5-bisphosphate 5-phosphatase A isoform X2 [Culex quinquefasciatus]XP_038109291.1 phosphatidylinositol 4,5-bisphosphate 5-phosphatase A isoform X2 [Culex quinquefasciatus]XP_038109292.1 phosphatidylinositol 4,5-bisphosphate 5-phosphatase A isoform X2 [Culex quinquef
MSRTDNNWNVKTLLPHLFRIYIVTWNVSTKFPDNISLNKLLGLEASAQSDADLPDFFVFGLQEVNAQPQNTLYNLFKDDLWTQKFKDLLKDRDYVVIKTEQMQGLLLSVFARRKHLLHLRQVETEYTRTGLGGIWGNKGAVSIRLNVYGCSICLVNAHLAAHDHMLEERINDYEKIVQEHKFHVKAKEAIFDHDYVFWFGDLNFRLTGEATTSAEEIRAMVARDELKKLIEKDQLLLVRREGRAFQKLQERLPQFPPTFKFEHGSSEYDMKRRPAWTDRILYAVRENTYQNVKLTVEQTSYKSHPSYNISDHKPVSSEFTIKVMRKPQYSGERFREHHYQRLSYRLAIANGTESVAQLHSFDDLVSDFIDGGGVGATSAQIYEDTTERTVVFKPIELWLVGEQNRIEYTIPAGFEEGTADWIGIYREDFTSLNDYLAYEYTESCKEHKQHQMNEQQTQYLKNARTMELTFSENVNVPLGVRYQLLYFQSTGSRGVTGLVGISNTFAVEKRCPSPSFDDID